MVGRSWVVSCLVLWAQPTSRAVRYSRAAFNVTSCRLQSRVHLSRRSVLPTHENLAYSFAVKRQRSRRRRGEMPRLSALRCDAASECKNHRPTYVCSTVWSSFTQQNVEVLTSCSVMYSSTDNSHLRTCASYSLPVTSGSRLEKDNTRHDSRPTKTRKTKNMLGRQRQEVDRVNGRLTLPGYDRQKT